MSGSVGAGILAVAAIITLCAYSSAAETKAPAADAEFPPMPEMTEMSDISAPASETPEQLTLYQAGVQAYLNGKDDDAIASLNGALRLDPANEKANRLLLKVLLRTINDNYSRGNSKKARYLVQEARRRFPSNPEIKLLYSSIQEQGTAAAPREISPARPETPSSKRKTKSADRTESQPAEPAPAPRQKAESAAAAGRVPSAPSNTEPPAAERAWAALMAAAGGHIVYVVIIAAAFPLAALLIFTYLQQKHQKALLLQIETLQKAMMESEKKKDAAGRELEIWKGFGKQVEELELLRKAKEQSMHLELEKMKAAEERKIMDEIAQKRRDAEHMAQLEAAMLRQAPPAAVIPAPVKPPAPPPPPPPISVREAEHAAARSQETKILDMLVNIAPPEREAAWERIAVQSADLYAVSPEEAVKFFHTIAGDNNPLNRASIAGGLARIGVPSTLDILLELYRDKDLDVQREILKQLNNLLRSGMEGIDEAYRDKIAGCLKEEKEKGDWVF